MDEEQQLDILQKLCTEQDFAWLVSDKCWIRERWSYFLPIVSKEEIESCFYDQNDSSSKLQKLQDKQERLFDAIVRLNGQDVFDQLDLEVPYIVGSMTNYKFEVMQPFGDYMFSIDPNSSQVTASSKTKMTSVDKHVVYCQSW